MQSSAAEALWAPRPSAAPIMPAEIKAKRRALLTISCPMILARRPEHRLIGRSHAQLLNEDRAATYLESRVRLFARQRCGCGTPMSHKSDNPQSLRRHRIETADLGALRSVQWTCAGPSKANI